MPKLLFHLLYDWRYEKKRKKKNPDSLIHLLEPKKQRRFTFHGFKNDYLSFNHIFSTLFALKVCCELLVVHEKFSSSCVKLTLFLHPVNTERSEKGSPLFVITAWKKWWLMADRQVYEQNISVKSHTHTHIKQSNRSIEAGLCVRATRGSVHPEIQRPTTQQHPQHHHTHRDAERTNTHDKSHHYY